MDLSTSYMGIPLKNPLVASASPLSESISKIRLMEDAGISAVVMHSLFEEQITNETYELHHHLAFGTESNAEGLTYFPQPSHFVTGPEEYLEQIRKAKEAVSIPIIGSLNGHSRGGWTKYARNIEEAGADAIELNVYFIPTSPNETGKEIEDRYVDILKEVKAHVKIPVAVKLSPFFSSTAHVAKRLDEAGAQALVLFNRFYQPDIDLENKVVVPSIELSTPAEMRLPLQWIAILSGNVKADLAATTGIHGALDVLKMVMVGANVTMLCSTLLRNGVPYAVRILEQVKAWMAKNEYVSIKQMRGSMSFRHCENPGAFERANYMKMISSGIFAQEKTTQ